MSAGITRVTIFSVMSSRRVSFETSGAVLSGDDDRVDADGTAVVVFDRDLRLAIGTEIIEQAVTPRARESLDQLVRQRNRQRHELVGLGAGVAEHEALIAGAAWIDALGDVGRLLVNRGQNGARLVVEPVFRPGVADILDRIADDLLVVHGRLRGDLAGDHGDAGGHERLARDTPGGVLRENGVENGIGNLVGDLVGMAFGDGLRSEQVSALTAHSMELLR